MEKLFTIRRQQTAASRHESTPDCLSSIPITNEQKTLVRLAVAIGAQRLDNQMTNTSFSSVDNGHGHQHGCAHEKNATNASLPDLAWDSASSTSTTSTGIRIPELLQPILGVAFLPFLSSQDVDSLSEDEVVVGVDLVTLDEDEDRIVQKPEETLGVLSDAREANSGASGVSVLTSRDQKDAEPVVQTYPSDKMTAAAIGDGSSSGNGGGSCGNDDGGGARRRTANAVNLNASPPDDISPAIALSKSRKGKKIKRLTSKLFKNYNRSSSSNQYHSSNFSRRLSKNIQPSMTASTATAAAGNERSSSFFKQRKPRRSTFMEMEEVNIDPDGKVASTLSFKDPTRSRKTKSDNIQRPKTIRPRSISAPITRSPDWPETMQSILENYQSHLQSLRNGISDLRRNKPRVESRVKTIRQQINSLQQQLDQAQSNLSIELANLESADAYMLRLQEAESEAAKKVEDDLRVLRDGMNGAATMVDLETPPVVFENGPMVTPGPVELKFLVRQDSWRGHKPPPFDEIVARSTSIQPILQSKRQPSCSNKYMRVSDLKPFLVSPHELALVKMESASTLSSSTSSLRPPRLLLNNIYSKDFFFLDDDISTTLKALMRLGRCIVTDEGPRFAPTRETERLLEKYGIDQQATTDEWPIQPWHKPRGSDILIWIGKVDGGGFGSDWPLCKARTIVKLPPKQLQKYLHDSSKIKEYNKMSLGRKDELVIQKGVGTKEEESAFGFAGDAKITMSMNKPKLFPKTIEMLSLMYTVEFEEAPGSYIAVTRSVFDDDSGDHKCTRSHIRSEMLLGVVLIRPADTGTSEMTTITQVYTPGVPSALVKSRAPSTAQDMIREIQKMFE